MAGDCSALLRRVASVCGSAAFACALPGTWATAQSPDAAQCPKLSAGADFQWSYQQGPDFDLCHARPTTGGPEFFGLYRGFAPAFHPPESTQRERGSVGGFEVVWYDMPSEGAGDHLRQETLFKLRPSPDGYELEVHVWLDAPTPEQMAAMKQIVANLSFDGID